MKIELDFEREDIINYLSYIKKDLDVKNYTDCGLTTMLCDVIENGIYNSIAEFLGEKEKINIATSYFNQVKERLELKKKQQ